MPYIPQERRKWIKETFLPHLSVKLTDGECNYLITEIVLRQMNGLNYSEIQRTVGLIECVKAEYYRRVAGQYEDWKRAAHGEVYDLSMLESKGGT